MTLAPGRPKPGSAFDMEAATFSGRTVVTPFQGKGAGGRSKYYD